MPVRTLIAGGVMGRRGERSFNGTVARALIWFTALLFPQVAHAACPPPKTPPAANQFSYCFDASKIGPQPTVDPLRGPYLVIEVELNGHRLPALLDTGAGISAVDSSVAKDIGLKATGSNGLTGIDGRTTHALEARIDQLVIGAFIRRGGTVAVTDLSSMSQVARQPFAMIVGADVLSHLALAVNRDNQSVILMPSNASVNGSSQVAPLRLQQPDNMFMTDMSIDGRATTVRVDTGADDELILLDSKWRAIVPSSARTTTMLGVGTTGMFIKPLVRLANLRIGGQSINDALATQVSSAVSTGGADGIVGMGTLSHFNLFLNPQAGVLVLTRPVKPAPPRRETMVGILGVPTDEGINVIHVMAHSPAEGAGLKAGDRICTVDGEKVSAAWEGTLKNDWMTGPAGKTVVLGRCGGGDLRVTLKRFY